MNKWQKENEANPVVNDKPEKKKKRKTPYNMFT